MILRTVLIGLSVAMLAGPSLAAEASSGLDQQSGGAGFVLDRDDSQGPGQARMRKRRTSRRGTPTNASAARPDGATSIGEEGASPAVAAAEVKRHRQPSHPHIANVTPPTRPAELDETSTGAAPVPTDRGPVLDGLAAQEVSPGALAASVGAVAVVTVLPPLRPSLPALETSAEAPTDAASLLPDVMGSPAGKFVYVLPPQRPAFRSDEPQAATAEAIPVPMTDPAQPQSSLFSKLFGLPLIATPSLLPAVAGAGRGHNGIDGLVTTYAKLNGVPEALVHRIIVRESKYNPRAVGLGGALGLMQIKHGTARALGYDGPASGLLDAETNITYAVKYLAGAYRTAGGDFDRAVQYYARGYYYAAKRQGGGIRLASRHGRRGNRQEAEAQAEDGAVVAAVQAQ